MRQGGGGGGSGGQWRGARTGGAGGRGHGSEHGAGAGGWHGGGGGGGGYGGGGGGGRDDGPKKPPKCFRCGNVGHVSRDCVSENTVQQRDFRTPPMPHHSVSFIDTHCHVDYICEQSRTPTWGEFKAKIPMPKTYDSCITTFCDSTAICSTFSQYEDLVTNHPDVYHTWGLHPHNAKYWNSKIESRIMEMVAHDKCVGFGEIGLDVTSEKKGGSEETEQLEVFHRQLELASVFKKPIVIHYRGPGTVLYDLLKPMPSTQKFHLHCWGDPSTDTAERLMSQFPNLCFGFTGGIVNNAKMRPLIAALPSSRILLESDGPYMLPGMLKPPKGSRIPMPVNHPGNIPYTADEIANIRHVSLDRLLLDVQQNVKTLYGIEPRSKDGKGGLVKNAEASSSPPAATAGGDASVRQKNARSDSASTLQVTGQGLGGGEKNETTYQSNYRPYVKTEKKPSPQAPPQQPRTISLDDTVKIYGAVLDRATIKDIHGDVRGNRVEVYSMLTALTGIDPTATDVEMGSRSNSKEMKKELSKDEWPELQ